MPATKLTDTQLVTLSAASRREDRGVVLPSNLKGGAAHPTGRYGRQVSGRLIVCRRSGVIDAAFSRPAA